MSRGAIGRATSLDELDGRLIAALQDDGRRPFDALATELGVPVAVVQERYRRLVDSGAVHVTAITNPLGIGYEAMAMLGVQTQGPPQDVADAIADWPEAIYVVVVAGRFDVLVELVARDRDELLGLTARVRELPAVLTTETFAYLDLAKQLFDPTAEVAS